MTVPTSDNREEYTGNDATTSFDYAFKIFEDSDLQVYLQAADGTETLLVLNTDYSVSGAGDLAGGSVTYPLSGDPLASDEKLIILRVLDVVQETDLRNQGAYYPQVVEDEFDRSRMIDQQQQEELGRTLTRPPAEDGYDADGRQIKNVADATDDGDAVNKGQIDARFASQVITQTGGNWDGKGKRALNFQTSDTPSNDELVNRQHLEAYFASVVVDKEDYSNLRSDLADNSSGNGSDRLAHTGTSDTVTEALDKRTIFVGSVAELEGLSLAEGVNVYLTEDGKQGAGTVKTGTPPSDTRKGIYIVLANGNYWERDFVGPAKDSWFGTNRNGTDSDVAILTDVATTVAALGITCELVGPSYLLESDVSGRFFSFTKIDFPGAGTILPFDDFNPRSVSNLLVGNEDYVNADAEKDGVYIGRKITGIPNCHGFTDRTLLDGVPDGWGYGVFDSVVRVQGAVAHAHVYSFQDRTDFGSSVSVNNLAGLLSNVTHSGTGDIDERAGVVVKNINVTGGGTVQHQYGVHIENLSSSFDNKGVFCEMTGGYSWYAAAGAKMYQQGEAGFGTDAIAGATIAFSTDSGTTKGLLGATAAKGAYISTIGAGIRIGLATNNVVRFDAGTNDLSCTTDNTSTLGTASFRYSEVFAANGTINTSDEREKEQQRDLSEAEKRVAQSVKSLIKAFKWTDAVTKKGSGARWHFGVMAQEVVAAFESEGLDAMKYGMVCYDEWEGGDRYGVRYDQLLAFVISQI